MTKGDLSEVNGFISMMGNRSSDKIPVVYMQDTKDVIVETKGNYTNKKLRYESGKDVVFKCKSCGDIIGKGKKTQQLEDKVKIYCYKCKKHCNCDSAIIWNKDKLWHKPEADIDRKQYEVMMNKYLESNVEIIEI